MFQREREREKAHSAANGGIHICIHYTYNGWPMLHARE